MTTLFHILMPLITVLMLVVPVFFGPEHPTLGFTLMIGSVCPFALWMIFTDNGGNNE